MFEQLKATALSICDGATCHRTVHAALSACHCWTATVSHEPLIYGAMALLYAVMAVRG